MSIFIQKMDKTSRERFYTSLDKGFSLCDVMLEWNSTDQLYDNVTYPGWHTGYSDAQVRFLGELPLEEGGMLIFLAEFTEQAEAVCPRATLRRAGLAIR